MGFIVGNRGKQKIGSRGELKWKWPCEQWAWMNLHFSDKLPIAKLSRRPSKKTGVLIQRKEMAHMRDATQKKFWCNFNHIKNTFLQCFSIVLEVGSFVVVLDAFLSMEAQVTVTAKSTLYHLRLVKQLVPYLDYWDLATVNHEMVFSRLHYCKSLYGGPWTCLRNCS